MGRAKDVICSWEDSVDKRPVPADIDASMVPKRDTPLLKELKNLSDNLSRYVKL